MVWDVVAKPTHRIRTLKRLHSERRLKTTKTKATGTCSTTSGWFSWPRGLLGPDRFCSPSSWWLCRGKKRRGGGGEDASMSHRSWRPRPRSQWTPGTPQCSWTYIISTLGHPGPAGTISRWWIIWGRILCVGVKHTQRSSLTMTPEGPAGGERETPLWERLQEKQLPPAWPGTLPCAPPAEASAAEAVRLALPGVSLAASTHRWPGALAASAAAAARAARTAIPTSRGGWRRGVAGDS